MRVLLIIVAVLTLGACNSSPSPLDQPSTFEVPVRHVVFGPDGYSASATAFGVDDPTYPYRSQEIHHFTAAPGDPVASVWFPETLRDAPVWAIGRTAREHWLGGHDTNPLTSQTSRRVDVSSLDLPAHLADDIGSAFEVRSGIGEQLAVVLYGCREALCYALSVQGPNDGSERAQALYTDLLAEVTIES